MKIKDQKARMVRMTVQEPSCWFCVKPLDPEGLPFFCSPKCGYDWAVREAVMYQKIKDKHA